MQSNLIISHPPRPACRLLHQNFSCIWTGPSGLLFCCPFPAPHRDPFPVPPLSSATLPATPSPPPCPCPSPSGALIATWREKGCTSFWRVIRQYPLLRSHVQCWKACFVIHRAFRDGHPNVSEKQTFYHCLVFGKHFTHCISAWCMKHYVSACV